jgi:hypothetical protein
MRNYVMLLAGGLILLLTGCASAPAKPSSQNASANLFLPPSNRALIFIYRNGNEGIRETVMPQLVTVSVNGFTLGQTADKTYFRLNVKPGTYTITSLAENVAKLNLTVEAGKIYYVQQEISSWSLSPKSVLQQVDENKGHAAVFGSKIIASNVSDAKLSVSDTPASASSETQASAPLSEKLRELQGLKNDGLITEEEFQMKRQQLLEKF